MSQPTLATGWEPDADPGDTFLRREVLNLAARYRFCAQRAGVDHLDGTDLVGVRLSEDSPWGNDIVLLRPLDASGVPDLVERLSDEVTWPSCVWSAWPTPDLGPRGLELLGHPPWMLRPPGGSPPPGATKIDGVEIVEVADDKGMADYDWAVIRGFPLMYSDGRYLPGVLRPSFVGGPWRFFVAYVDGAPVSVASAFVAEGISQVEWVATLPDHRGKGIGEALTWRATLAEPDLPATLIASDLGRPIYERIGFLPLQRMTMWHWKGSAG